MGMSKESISERKDAGKEAVFRWRDRIGQHKVALFFAILGGGVAAVAGGFGIPTILKSMIPVIFDGAALPEWAQQLLLRVVQPEDLVSGAVWAAAASFPILGVLRGL